MIKILYFILSIYFTVHLVNIFLSYQDKNSQSTKSIVFESVSSINHNIKIDKNSYIFTDKAWAITRVQKNLIKETKDDNSTNSLVVNRDSYPIAICDAKECFEFIALKNNKAIFYGKIDSNNTGFISLYKNEKLNKRILIKNIESKKIELYDLEFNQTITINMFDLNISQYQSKEKEINNETK